MLGQYHKILAKIRRPCFFQGRRLMSKRALRQKVNQPFPFHKQALNFCTLTDEHDTSPYLAFIFVISLPVFSAMNLRNSSTVPPDSLPLS